MTYSRASEFFKKELVKVLMLKITDFTVYDLVVLQLQLLWVFQTACYRGKEGWRTAKAKNNYIDESKNSLLHITKIMQKA
jgi:hypothetical protein